MKKINLYQLLSLLMLVFAIGFNLWLYRLEPTAKIDPNDNTFQFALVDRTNQIWDFALKKCSSSIGGILTFPICHFSYLADHWVPNWAQGYNLPYYYSHIPQIVIVGGWRFVSLFIPALTLFQFYHIVIYLLLCFFPLSIFLALLVLPLSPLTAGIGALLAMNLSTDGLYGLDPSSFLWRGYGLSSQLFAMVWFPLALAYSYRYFTQNFNHQAPNTKQIPINKYQTPNNWVIRILNLFDNWNLRFGISKALPAIFFLAATTAGHLGIGMIAMLSVGFLAISFPIMAFLRQQNLKEIFSISKEQMIRLTLVAGVAIFLLSYWIVPTFIHDKFHNISFWDPVWKFDSYGWKETMIRLFNGDLFDFGRAQVITYLTILGAIVSMIARKSGKIFARTTSELRVQENFSTNEARDLSPFALLFVFWILFYFGRTTWGGLIDLIPGMKEFHLSRFLVGVHISGMILAPIGFVWLADFVSRYLYIVFRKFIHISPNTNPQIPVPVYLTSITLVLIVLLPPVYKWTVTYNELNDRLIIQANTNYAKIKTDEELLFAKLRSLPTARIFAGRGGTYGKTFEVAETPYFMHLSTYGLQTTLWLPETWSMNSDTEQYFSEDKEKDYDLYNIRYAVAPPDYTPQPFWQYLDGSASWKLYQVPTSGYFTVGVRAAVVATDKRSFINVEHLWIQSDAHKLGLFPELTYAGGYPKKYGLPNFRMIDEANYVTPASPNEPSQGGPDGKVHNIWTEPPLYLPDGFQSQEQLNAASRSAYNDMKLIGPEVNETDMILKTKVEVGAKCLECIVVLKETFHPGWRVTVDGKSITPFIVFPFFIGIPVLPGTHTIVASYEPSTLKVGLLWVTILTVVLAIFLIFDKRKRYVL
jgi:hypothetical protein